MIEVLNPTAGPATGKIVMAKRTGTLDGQRIGVIWNGRPYGDKVINSVIDMLRQKYSFESVVFRKKPYIGNVAPVSIQEEIIDSCDVVITGIGD
ncbi:MAG: hypothetical protein HQ475_03620 [SAR202 cluster bacterium]|nr:hypothetical protein [SAR202 cluster bacterium]